MSVEVVISLLPDENGRAARMLGISRDITARVKAEEGLRKYELIANSSRDIVLFLDLEDGRIIEANHAATLAYGYTREELLTMTICDCARHSLLPR